MEGNVCFMNDPRLIWFVLGLVLIIAEFMIPGVVIIFFGVAAWVLSLLCFIMPLSLNAQLLIFLVTAVSSLLLFRKVLKQKLLKGKMSGEVSSALEDEFIGQKAEVIKDINPPHEGKISLKGASWTAISEESIAVGEYIEIIGKESIKLIVKKIDK